ncbi:MAG: formate dehydrogenase subunit alpha [Candidatus Korarchaeota archaeon]
MENKITIWIDDKEIKTTPDKTVLEVARENGIYIPTLCYLEGMSLWGACRVCVVEVAGARNLMTACTTQLKDGMKVYTNTERVRRARKTILQLIWAAHPNDCAVCEKAGACELQNLMYMYVGKEPFPLVRRERPAYNDKTHPFINIDMRYCVQCGRCVWVTSSKEVCNVLTFANRGVETVVTTEFGKPLMNTSCVSCGSWVNACPVVALYEKNALNKGRMWELQKVPTVCPYCGVGCQIIAWKRGNEIVKITADPKVAPDINGLLLCVKGKFGFEYVSHKDRLTTPLIRGEDGKLHETTWDEALKYAATKIREIIKKYGPESIAVLSSAKATNEENYLMQKLARAVIGTPHIDHCARLCHASTVAGLAKTLGSGAMTNSIKDIDLAEVILVTGSNTTEAHPVIGARIKEAVLRGAKLIVVDPREIELTKYATIWLRQKPGYDIVWINGMLNVIINEKLYDEEFIKNRTTGWEEVVKTVQKYTPEYVEKVTGIPADKLREAARLYAKAKNAMIFYAMGITQHTEGTNNVIAISNLALATGHVGRPGNGVNPLRGQNNVQGACDMGCLPNVFPGYQKVVDSTVREKFEKAWGVKLPDKPGLTLVEIFLAAAEGAIKGMIILGENPALSDPDITHVREALEKLEFLLVIEILPSETTQYADVVLPAASSFEKDGTYTNTERRILLGRKVIDPPGNAKPDWQIICELARHLGYEMNYNSPAEIMKEIASLTPIYGGVSYSRLEKGNFPQWPVPTEDHPGTPYLHKEKFAHPDGRAKFIPVDFKGPVEQPDKEYPFILTTGRVLYHWHTGTMTRRVDGLNVFVPGAYVEINSEDAKRMEIKNGDKLEVESKRGKIILEAKVTERVAPGVLFIPFHFAEAAANVLTISALDPDAKIPEFKVAAVKLKKVV